ncbi:hypothetical protein BDU57DRAFT_595540 [Ampelomyces quisqualis]|uniref:Uncharacterized protein n=1 Tax=Ampelomyces quisqualis TaxID=50730 RepID=A0A6A5QSV8_AMPQU|nr:hypothetical protein BDU57DRAFT_595540 [Ampelomyces quisqualis]
MILCTTQFVTFALLGVLLAQPSHALWNVYARFIPNPYSPDISGERIYDVGKRDCINGKGLVGYHISFHKFRTTIFDKKPRVAKGPYCLHYYYNGHCPKENPEGDARWQYQNVRLNKKDLTKHMYDRDIGHLYIASFKWTLGKCSNPNRTTDGSVTEAF